MEENKDNEYHKENVSIKDSFSNHEILKSSNNSINQKNKLIKEKEVQIEKQHKKENENEENVKYDEINNDNEEKKEEIEEEIKQQKEKKYINDMFDSDSK